MKPEEAVKEKSAAEQPIIKEPESESESEPESEPKFETKDDSETPSSDWSKLADPISEPAKKVITPELSETQTDTP